MTDHFESEKNKKAFLYTAMICGALLLLFIIISWKVLPPAVPVIPDLMEINLGNNEEGFGDEQPLKKGNRTPSKESVSVPKQSATRQSEPDKVNPEDNAPDDAAPVNKPIKNIPKIKSEVSMPVVTPTPKPQKPKITYDGPDKGPPGNNSKEDNLYKSQGPKPGANNDDGDPKGNKDSFGNTPGGKIGGPKVTSGNRRIKSIGNYSFTGNLSKATIYAVIKVSPSGHGTFIKLVKPSTSFEKGYGSAIGDYLPKIEFHSAAEESIITVQFNFTVN